MISSGSENGGWGVPERTNGRIFGRYEGGLRNYSRTHGTSTGGIIGALREIFGSPHKTSNDTSLTPNSKLLLKSYNSWINRLLKRRKRRSWTRTQRRRGIP